jgi:hypothetical protein
MAQYFRSEAEVVSGETLSFPFPNICPDLDNPRNAAIIEVLRRIPVNDFRVLEEMVGTFTWYIPECETLAGVMPFYSTHPGEPIKGAGFRSCPTREFSTWLP